MNNRNIEISNISDDGIQPDFFDILLSSSAGFPIYLSISDFNKKEFMLPEHGERDFSEILLENENFRESIKRARKQMREGTQYLSHDQVFGE